MSNSAPVSSLQTLSDALSTVVADAVKSVVAVHSSRSRSSGFVWRPGLIVTADEALAEDAEIAVMSPGGAAVATTLVGRDSTTDIALLRADGFNAPVATLQSTPPRAGALALAVGAGRNEPIAAFGAVSSAGPAWRSLRGGEIDARVELDLSLRRAGEGGLALEPLAGRSAWRCLGRAEQFSTSGRHHRACRRQIADARPDRARNIGLGLQAAKLDGDGGIGAMVMSVDPTGPGAAGGVRQGDLIVNWNGERIRDVRTLLRALGPDSVGQSAKLSLSRGGAPIEIALTIAERPES